MKIKQVNNFQEDLNQNGKLEEAIRDFVASSD